MGFMLRVRLLSFVAGAATASVAGFYFLYKDYILAQQILSQQVKDAYDSLDGRIEVLHGRITELEKLKTVELPAPVEGSE